MRFAKRSSRRKPRSAVRRQRQFERLEDRRLMAVVLAQSTFSASLMGDNIDLMSEGNAVGYGYAISYQGNPAAAVGGDGQARTDADESPEGFSSLTEMDISSVSKTVTATAILHILQSQPGGLDAALSTPLADYLPSDWTPGENVQLVTLRHLLTHRSGFQSAAEDNDINVNFGTPSNATYANLKSLVESDLPEPDVDFEPTYHGPRWFSSYNNANFAILARVVLPKLTNPGINLTAANYVDRDLTSGTIYKEYVQDEIFEALGIFGADLDVSDPYPTLGYLLGVNAPGEAPIDRTRTGGAGGWKMDARELARFLDGIQRDNSILSAATRQMRNNQGLGWGRTENAFGDSFSHNGANGDADVGLFRSQIIAMPGEVEVGYLMNSEWSNLPGENIFNMLQTAYVNAWTDLTASGTSGDDVFVIRLNNSGFQPSIEVELNGVVEFTHWINTLDSLTLNGGAGHDTFTIEGWNSSIDLEINGGSGDDLVHVLPGVRNLEYVNGMTFVGGTGDDSLTVSDQNNPYSNIAYSRLYTVSSGAVTRFAAHPAFPGNPGLFIPVTVSFPGVENLDVVTGGQYDAVNVASKTSGETSVRTGAGDDTIIVAQTAGNIETVDDLQVDGQAGLDTIRLFDHNKTSTDPQASAQYDVDAGSVSRYMASLGGIGIGEPSGFEVQYSHVENLELTMTDLVDVIRVHATLTGATTIHGGAGNDVLNASPDGKNLELVDDLTFHGDAGVDAIVLNDQSNPYSHPGLSRVYGVTAAGVARSAAMPGNPFAIPIAIDVATYSVEELTLKTGGQTDVVNVESVPSGGAVIQTGPGNDVVNASSVAANVETVNGLEVDGGLGNDALNISDENNPYELPGGSDYTITPTSLSRYAEHVLLDDFAVPVNVEFAGIESLSLAAGNQQDEFAVEGIGDDASLQLDGNAGGDLFNVVSPAFASINIQGDAPIFAPGDRLSVNEDGLYGVASIPGLYPIGAGAVTIGATTIQYSGIEQSDVHRQIYSLPGDFDLNGEVNGEDLTHVSLGWFARFGGDLDGRDFLTWQRHLGDSVQPEGGLAPLASPPNDFASALESSSDPLANVAWLAFQPIESASDSIGVDREVLAQEADGTLAGGFSAVRGGSAATLAAPSPSLDTLQADAKSDDDATADLWPVDAAFAEFGLAIGAI